jgi:ABC-type sugar transport system permease subunit
MGAKQISKFTPYLWIVVPFALSCVFRFYPFIRGSYLSFQEWDGINPAIFIGLANFRELIFQDRIFHQALGNNIIFAIGTVTGKMALGLTLAALLNQKIKGLTFFRTILFSPVVISFVVVGLMWRWMLDFNFGLINSVFRSLNLNFLVQDWLGDPNLALNTIIFIDIWKWYGFHMVIFLAAMQGIPTDLYESAYIDGCSKVKSFFYITLPLLKSVLKVNITIALMGAFNVFDLVFVMTEGGPFNSTMVVAVHMFIRGFQFNRMGYATAMQYLLFAIVVCVSAIQLKMMNKDNTTGEG